MPRESHDVESFIRVSVGMLWRTKSSKFSSLVNPQSVTTRGVLSMRQSSCLSVFLMDRTSGTFPGWGVER